jgi:colanic acid biosynthesis glycosyl transferase WcaI
MKILFLTQYFPPEVGAAQTRLQSMVEELRDLGHSVEVVTAFPNYPHGRIATAYRGSFYRHEISSGVDIHRVWLFPAMGSGLLRMLGFLSFSLTSLWGLFRANTPDYLFVESPPPMLALPAFIYSRIRGVPFILNIADLWLDTVQEFGLLKKGWLANLLFRLEKCSFDKAAYVNAVTDGNYEILLRKKGVPADKLLYLPNGVNTRKFQPQPADGSLISKLALPDKKIILYAGTLGAAHGLTSVLEAAKLLENEADIHFLFLGDGSARKDLQKMQVEMGLRNVSFRDPVPVEDVPTYYSIATCGLASLRNVPIFESARPSKVFPAMACGKPLIFAGSGEMARLLRSANAGLVIPSETPRALADAVLRLARDSEFATQLGANGRRFVEDHHQWSKLVGRWIASLDQKCVLPVAEPGLSR